MTSIKHVEYILVHLDGVILKNILGSILLEMMESFGIEYTLEIEKNILARPLEDIGHYLRTSHGLPYSNQELFDKYLVFRSNYERDHSIKEQEGLASFLERMKSLNLRLIAYGGAPFEYFAKNMVNHEMFFLEPRYIQTRDFRPGLLEIIQQLKIQKYQIVFIDEESNVANVAIGNQIPFIGFNDNFPRSHQPIELRKLNLDYMVTCLDEITIDLLHRIDGSLSIEKEKLEYKLLNKQGINNE